MNLNHIVQIEVGDSGGDGHGKHETFTYSCTHDSFEVKQAFKKGTDILGFDITKYCDDYEDNSIPQDVYEKLVELNAIPEWLISYVDEFEEEPYVDAETYANIYMLTAQKGLPELRYTMRRNPAIKAGGYGLFT